MKLYNTLTRKKEEFKPIEENKVRMYSCGPTVYNFFHIGNARPFIIFDTLRRYFEYSGYDVKFVQNFTDIDDKMIRNANELGITVKDLADKYIAEYAESTTERGKCLAKAICEKLGFDSLGYQSLDGLLEAIGIDKDKICTYCWNGKG